MVVVKRDELCDFLQLNYGLFDHKTENHLSLGAFKMEMVITTSIQLSAHSILKANIFT